jgi:hypothetical protein
LTVEGTRVLAPKTGVSTLRVHAINGRKVPQTIAIWVDNLDLPKDAWCRIKGYETVRMIGKAPAELDAEVEDGRSGAVPQAVWQIQCYFVALKVLQPEELKLKPRER